MSSKSNSDEQSGAVGGKGKRPAVRVRIVQDDSVQPGEFSPLSTPRDIRISTAEVTPSLLQRLRASLAVELRPGDYSLTVFEDEPLPATVPEGCRAHLTLSAGVAADSTDGTPMVTGMEFSFDRPLVLGNILALLAKLQTRFADHDLSALMTRTRKALSERTPFAGLRSLGREMLHTVAGRFPEAAAAAGLDVGSLKVMGAALGKSAKEAATVLIERISARPVVRKGAWHLELRFTGVWDFAGQVKFPFHQVRVHRAILPSPHALLDDLFSAQPLATASLRRGNTPGLRLAQEFGTMVSSFSGHLTAAGISPDLAATILTSDGGCLELDATGDQHISLHARLSGKVSQSALEFAMHRADLVVAGEKTGMAAIFNGWTGRPSANDPADTAIGRCFESLYSGEWSSDKLGFRVETSLSPGSKLAGFDIALRYEHPLLKGRTDLSLGLTDLELDGTAGVVFGKVATVGGRALLAGREEAVEGPARPDIDLAFRCRADVRPGSHFGTGRASIFPRCEGADVSGSLRSAGLSGTVARVKGSARGRLDVEAALEPFPELSIDEGKLTGVIEGAAEFDAQVELRDTPRHPVEADFRGTSLEVTLRRTTFELDKRRLSLPRGSVVKGSFEEGVLRASGLGRAKIGLAWDLLGESPVLKHPGGAVELFLVPLRQGELDLHLSPIGGISVSGEEWGLFDARYFNALINPEAEPERLLDILRSDEALDRVFDTVAAFSSKAVDMLTKIRNFVRDAEEALDDEGVSGPADAVPGPMLARLLSRIVFNGKVSAEKLYPLVRQVTDGKGLNVARLKHLLSETAPDHEYDFEVDRVLRLFGRLLSPAEPPAPPARQAAIPLSETPEYLRQYASIPTAREIYETVDSAEVLPREFSGKVARIAPYLTLEQIDYILSRGREDWASSDLARITDVHELKRRIRDISQGYGGMAYAPQAMAIAFFLGETIRRGGLGVAAPGGWSVAALMTGYDFAHCLLGPEDVAVLLHAGLASAVALRGVQLNQRMLMDLILEQPPSYLRAVLIELGGGDPRVLTGALNALLAQPQDAMREPLDLVSLFGERLGFQFPRLADFLAGGRRAGHSYYETLSRTADQVLSQSEPYRALKFHMQEVRHPVPRGYRPTPRRTRLLKEARAAILAADKVAARCTFKGREPVRRKRSLAAYQTAFEACAELSGASLHGFQLPEIRQFWQRNHEALVIRSVVRNVQEEIDEVPRWLAVRSGQPVSSDEQKILECVVDALYYLEDDRRTLKRDPLVRLLIDPPEGNFDFTLVSCMGVITGGAKGLELEQAYRRLSRQRGVTIIRADTGTGRGLEFNAQRIVQAIEKAEGPWGYVGYSQGCPNALKAEALLMSGTPAQQRLLDNFVCRNLLFSAFNASVHGTCGDKKFLDTMVYLDNFLAHYQARYSSRAIQTALGAIRFALDSRPFVLGMLGSRSLAVWGVLGLHRGGQFKDGVPTSMVRGIVEEETLPEALEFLSNVLTRQLESTAHDTQVSTMETAGHSIHVTNPHVDVLERCDMGCLVQRTHHWSPLKEDVEFVTTERDRRLAIYDFPKDRHVFPWLEVNARFGRIGPGSSSTR